MAYKRSFVNEEVTNAIMSFFKENSFYKAIELYESCLDKTEITQILSKIVKNSNSGDYLFSFDANSLYPSAKRSMKYYPDVFSSRLYIVGDDDYNQLISEGKFFIIQCDIWVPKELKFIPTPNKAYDKYKASNAGCFYGTGFYSR